MHLHLSFIFLGQIVQRSLFLFSLKIWLGCQVPSFFVFFSSKLFLWDVWGYYLFTNHATQNTSTYSQAQDNLLTQAEHFYLKINQDEYLDIRFSTGSRRIINILLNETYPLKSGHVMWWQKQSDSMPVGQTAWLNALSYFFHSLFQKRSADADSECRHAGRQHTQLSVWQAWSSTVINTSSSAEDSCPICCLTNSARL